MKNFMFYLISLGLAYYGGMKLTKSKVVVKEIIREVKIDNGASKTILSLRADLESCVESYDKLVSETNSKVKDLEEEINICSDRYYKETPQTVPHKNLEPETVEKKEPTLEDNYGDF